jgi:hypothetical protein
MSELDKQYQATDPKILREEIMDGRIPKNEREWWAKKEIEKLESDLSSLREKLKEVEARQKGTAVIVDKGRGTALKARPEWLDEKEEV